MSYNPKLKLKTIDEHLRQQAKEYIADWIIGIGEKQFKQLMASIKSAAFDDGSDDAKILYTAMVLIDKRQSRKLSDLQIAALYEFIKGGEVSPNQKKKQKSSWTVG